ncbi:hypothetical protein [Nocardia wallacei]|uniref:hypothetical protein n=1 Tax=Nocardia wallacei TaxID=480035 RepID=UPI002457A40D|nr:hypothetical protein [Nocardia wallacei]
MVVPPARARPPDVTINTCGGATAIGAGAADALADTPDTAVPRPRMRYQGDRDHRAPRFDQHHESRTAPAESDLDDNPDAGPLDSGAAPLHPLGDATSGDVEALLIPARSTDQTHPDAEAPVDNNSTNFADSHALPGESQTPGNHVHSAENRAQPGDSRASGDSSHVRSAKRQARHGDDRTPGDGNDAHSTSDWAVGGHATAAAHLDGDASRSGPFEAATGLAASPLGGRESPSGGTAPGLGDLPGNRLAGSAVGTRSFDADTVGSRAEAAYTRIIGGEAPAARLASGADAGSETTVRSDPPDGSDAPPVGTGGEGPVHDDTGAVSDATESGAAESRPGNPPTGPGRSPDRYRNVPPVIGA